jgi:4-alpha-glucanotransferase
VQLQRFDLVRIDHFRALAACWAVPAGAATARDGQWQPAPGHELLQALQRQYGEVPLVAEDLGLITPDVDELRRRFRLPGMRVLQFGFDGSPDNPHLPHNLQRDTVLYTGTHDNDTTLGWYRSLSPATAAHVDAYLRSEAPAMPRSLCAAALASVAQLAILPLQDLLALDSRARFNTPGTVSGNWQWRAQPQDCSATLAAELRALNQLYGRLP